MNLLAKILDIATKSIYTITEMADFNFISVTSTAEYAFRETFPRHAEKTSCKSAEKSKPHLPEI